MKIRSFPVLIFYLLLAACANLKTPNGGPKDERPPALLRSTPTNKQLNFKGKTVELTFDELIKIHNPKEEIIISPSPGKEIEITAKQTRLFITSKEGWKDSTTYTILFREGVQDITESNSPTNLKLAFSTGATIDSLRISGTVQELLKGIPVEKITVAIFSQDTFDIFRDTPHYFTKTDKKGLFSLENLKDGQYYIYAFDDKNKNLKVESRSERYGFIAKKLMLENHIDSLNIGLIILDSRSLKVTAIRNIGNVTRVRFNKYITDYTLEANQDVTNAFGGNQTEINLWNPDTLGDSIKIHLFASDSIDTRVDTIFYIKKTNAKPIKENFKWSLGTPAVDPETGKFITVMDFNKPVSTINFDSLFINLDSLHRVAISKENISINSKQKKITISKEIDKKIFKEEKDPELTLQAGNGFVYSIEGDSTKKLIVPISIQWPEDAGILFVQTITKEPNYLIQLLDGQGKLQRSIQNMVKYSFTNLLPADYQIRIIIDGNKNNKWDAGDFSKRLEPEKVIFYKTSEGKQSFPMRANWEYGPLLIKF